MSSIVSSVTGGGANNAGFTAKSADLLNPSTVAQANTAYDQTQSGLAQQQAFVQALQAQNGTQNQSNVYNQLQGVANGTGPNPAQAQLAQATGANVANQAALMAGQRGAGANAGMMARQAAMQGANTQQQAAGQGATMQANQSLNALNQMGGVAGSQVANQQAALLGYNNSAQGQQNNILNGIAGQNTAGVSNANQQNQANVQMAAQNAKGGSNMLGSLMGAAGTVFGGPLGAMAGSALGGMMGGGGGSSGGSMMAGGGDSPLGDLDGMATMMAAEGGGVKNGALVHAGPQSKVGQHMHMFAKGGKVPALVSPGERYLNPSAVNSVVNGANPMAAGEKIQGTPAVGGAKNSYANDTVHKNLDEGGIVLPRSVTQSKTPGKDAHKFVEAILARQGKTLPKKAK